MGYFDKVVEFSKTTAGMITSITIISAFVISVSTGIGKKAVEKYVDATEKSNVERNLEQLLLNDSIHAVQLQQIYSVINKLSDSVKLNNAITRVNTKHLLKHLNETSFQNDVICMLQEIISEQSRKQPEHSEQNSQQLPPIKTIITKIPQKK